MSIISYQPVGLAVMVSARLPMPALLKRMSIRPMPGHRGGHHFFNRGRIANVSGKIINRGIRAGRQSFGRGQERWAVATGNYHACSGSDKSFGDGQPDSPISTSDECDTLSQLHD